MTLQLRLLSLREFLRGTHPARPYSPAVPFTAEGTMHLVDTRAIADNLLLVLMLHICSDMANNLVLAFLSFELNCITLLAPRLDRRSC